jgi:predicted nucleic acid-binding protein
VILVDTSAWIEYLRATSSPADLRLRDLIEAADPLAVTEVVVMEVLAGGRDEARADRLARLLLRYEFLPVDGLADYEAAARLFRSCRTGGATIRTLNDCLIAVVALRNDVSLLAHDRDFRLIARHAPLRLEPVD